LEQKKDKIACRRGSGFWVLINGCVRELMARALNSFNVKAQNGALFTIRELQFPVCLLC
jgi:hypothetical protein